MSTPTNYRRGGDSDPPSADAVKSMAEAIKTFGWWRTIGAAILVIIFRVLYKLAMNEVTLWYGRREARQAHALDVELGLARQPQTTSPANPEPASSSSRPSAEPESEPAEGSATDREANGREGPRRSARQAVNATKHKDT